MRATTLKHGDEAAWSALQNYVETWGPTVGGEITKDPPCTFDRDDEYDLGDGHIDEVRQVLHPYAFENEGKAAAATVQRDGWQDDRLGTGATVTFFSGSRILSHREIFAAVEIYSAADLEEPHSQITIRYMLDTESC